ncbi:MAG: ribose-phosphate diphosphokinase [Gammaproteobacteria bacterium]|nr:ribose-phosphate diphosphokinase [Gammaproteobacteria bacterium]
MNAVANQPIVFALRPHALANGIVTSVSGAEGSFDSRLFPDGEFYLRIVTAVKNRDCVVLADLSHPDSKILPLIFLLETLRELGAATVGLVAPYLSYMRQDTRFVEGEAVTSRLFAGVLSCHIDWLVTVDPHLHRYSALGEIYKIPNRVVSGAPALAQWLKGRSDLFLVGPDSESEQWVSGIARTSGLPFVIGNKQRRGDRDVVVSLPDLGSFTGNTAVIVDDVIASGQTILQCILALRQNGISGIICMAVHGIFSDGIDERLLASGLDKLVTTNTIEHRSNVVDMSEWIAPAVFECINQVTK